MPSKTFLKLDPAKQKRVYDASMREFCRVPLEEVSIKNIVDRAEIARGSFYQYFAGKEDLFLYLLRSLRTDMTEILPPIENIFHFIYYLAEKEISAIQHTPLHPPVKSQLLRNMAASPAALNIFEKDISRSLKSNEIFQKILEDSGLAGLEESRLTALVEMLSQSLRHAVIQVLSSNRTAEDALSILRTKLSILKKGI